MPDVEGQRRPRRHRVVTVPTSGHFLAEEQPAAVVEAITGLIG
jgi:hypothetical protein